MENVLKVVNKILKNRDQITPEDIASSDELFREFDIEKVKFKYNQKIRQLIDYIGQIRSNFEFFNANIDNEILIQ